MVEGMVVTILTCLVIVWVGFSMAGRDEARVSSSVDLSKWYKNKQQANIVGMDKVMLSRDYVSILGRGVQEQSGYQLTLEYKDRDGNITKTKHNFYDDSEQDEEFLARYIKNNKIYVWLTETNQIYVPGETLENTQVQTVYGADKVLIYSLLSALVLGVITTLFLLFIKPTWIIFHVPILTFSSIVPQVFMYVQSINNEVQRRSYIGVSALSQYALYIDEDVGGLGQVKLVEQTLPMVLLEEGVGYLGYTPDKVSVLVDYDGNIPVHIASEYHIPKVITTILKRFE